jgi:benzoyl-CoA reductase/2-hydroxyglutaryl-CoA dehydratase subunit BcrC/BadD/HgdB
LNPAMASIKEIADKKFEKLKRIDKPKLGWLSIHTPEEIIHAAGIIPFRITGDRGHDTTGAGALLGNNYCSYVLSALSEAIDHVYDFADGVVFLDACDMRKRVAEVWARRMSSQTHYFLEFPKENSPAAKDYFKLQLSGLIGRLQSDFNCNISDTALHEAIGFFNTSRRLLQDLYALRKPDVPLISAQDAIAIVKASVSGLKEEFNQALADLLADLKTQKALPIKRPRVLLCGSYFDNEPIVEAVQMYGANLVCEDISYGVKYFEGLIDENSDPLDAIADYYLDKNTCARSLDTDRRIDHLLKLVREYNINAIIYYSLKFCDTNLMDYPYVRHRLLLNGIPVLLIEAEKDISNIENIKTRIQTFLDTIIF